MIKVELSEFEKAAAEEGLGPVTADNLDEIKDFMYGAMASVVQLVDTETVD